MCVSQIALNENSYTIKANHNELVVCHNRARYSLGSPIAKALTESSDRSQRLRLSSRPIVSIPTLDVQCNFEHVEDTLLTLEALGGKSEK
jgi:hypothetical protein